jgi:hypothetical protein
MHRMFTRTTAAATICICTWACGDDAPTVDCGADAGAPQIAAYVGAVQTDGSVTVYGTVQFDLTVRSLYVAGVEVTPTASGFNFRTWSVSIPQARLVAYAKGGGQAALPVVANLYGGCTAQLPLSEEPVVHGISADAGLGGADGAIEDAGDADVADGAVGKGADGRTADGPVAGD